MLSLLCVTLDTRLFYLSFDCCVSCTSVDVVSLTLVLDLEQHLAGSRSSVNVSCSDERKYIIFTRDTTKSYRFFFFFLLPPTERKCPRINGDFSLSMAMKLKALVTQWSSTFWVLVNCSLPGSSVHGILQARIMEWVTIPFSRGSSQLRDRTQGIAGRFFTIWATREALYDYNAIHMVINRLC